jgi:hypothetical protein
VSELSVESKRIDLLQFSATRELAELRERFSAPATLRQARESGEVARASVVSREWSEGADSAVDATG